MDISESENKEPEILDLEGLRDYFNDDQINQLLSSFVAQAQLTMADIVKAQAISDIKSLKIQAHKLKGAAAAIRAMHTANLSAKLEEYSANENSESISQIVKGLEKSISQVKQRLAAFSQY